MPNPSTLAHDEQYEQSATPATAEYRITLGLSASNKQGRYEISEEELLRFCSSTVSTIRDGFSITFGYGYWRGSREGSATISWIGSAEPTELADAYEIARTWNKRHNQECTLVSVHPVSTHEFVTGR